MFFDTGNVKHW